jgi:nanoRNase/pAp phosphatase (c-di-AMP/oligoRNAs hydrolase)
MDNKMLRPIVKRARRSDRLLQVLSEYERFVIVTHDCPDPDAIASACALAPLLEYRLKRPARIVAGGAVMRGENLRMLELLKLPIDFVDELDVSDPRVAVILVDSVPTAVNHLLANSGVEPVAVIDHHRPQGRPYRVRFRDIRPNLAATATIVTLYLREQNVPPTPLVATALLYGIRTDAVGLPRMSVVDQRAAVWLMRFADFSKLGEIENAPLSREYFSDLLLAMKNTFVYDDAALCFLPRAAGPEIVGEVADLLIRCRDVNRLMCAAVLGGDVLFSVRTTAAGGDATELMRKAIEGVGYGGGHRRRAGGKLIVAARSGRISEDLQTELRPRWLKACGIDSQRGTRLVTRREILEDL